MNISRFHMLMALSLCGGVMHVRDTRSSEQDIKSQPDINIIKKRVGILVITIVRRPDTVHPKHALALLILLIQQYLEVQKRADLHTFLLALEGCKREQSAKNILNTLEKTMPVDLLPSDIAYELQQLSTPEKFRILCNLNAELKKTMQDRNLDELQNLMFSNS